MAKDNPRTEQVIRQPAHRARPTRGGLRPGDKLVSELKVPPPPVTAVDRPTDASVAESPQPSSPFTGAASGDVAAPFTGRTSELSLPELEELAGKGSLVVVFSEAGAGKSALAHRILASTSEGEVHAPAEVAHSSADSLRVVVSGDAPHRRTALEQSLGGADNIEVIGAF